MQWTDLLIIYLSCGAPFGVYFLLRSPSESRFSGRILLRSTAVWLFWPVYAYLIWRKNPAKSLIKKEIFSQNPEISLLEQQTSVLQEQILQAFVDGFIEPKADIKPGFFAFRDVLERYIGLTLVVKADALKADETIAGEIDFEVFRIAGRKKKELPLAGKCLARKNSMRLTAHQSNARNDFLEQTAKLVRISVQTNGAGGNGRPQNISLLRDLILELFELIDVNTLPKAESIFNGERDARGFSTNGSENGFHPSEVTSCQPPAVTSASTSAATRSAPATPPRFLTRSNAE